MDGNTFNRFQAGLESAQTPADFARLSEELRVYYEAHPDDPDVPAIGEQLQMVESARTARRAGGVAAPR